MFDISEFNDVFRNLINVIVLFIMEYIYIYYVKYLIEIISTM